MSDDYTILENNAEWVVVRLTTIEPTADLLESIANINSKVFPIVITTSSLAFIPKSASGDNFGLILANNMAKFGSKTHKAVDEQDAIQWVKFEMNGDHWTLEEDGRVVFAMEEPSEELLNQC